MTMNEIVSTLLKGKIKIDFDPSKKVFFLSMPIFCSPSGLPLSVRQYVDSRQNYSFNPYRTSFQFEGETYVNLVQELPFQWGFQLSFREQVRSFRKLAAHCHHLLVEIAVEEKMRFAEPLIDFSLEV